MAQHHRVTCIISLLIICDDMGLYWCGIRRWMSYVFICWHGPFTCCNLSSVGCDMVSFADMTLMRCCHVASGGAHFLTDFIDVGSTYADMDQWEVAMCHTLTEVPSLGATICHSLCCCAPVTSFQVALDAFVSLLGCWYGPLRGSHMALAVWHGRTTTYHVAHWWGPLVRPA
jgi:hypothetical protein